MNIRSLLRPHLRNFSPYHSARHEAGNTEGRILLDANENNFGGPLPGQWHRYPDPLQETLKNEIAHLKGIAENNLFLGNGSDEAIDLLMRAFGEPGKDKILIMPPTYGMYTVAARLNNLAVVEVALQPDFQIGLSAALATLKREKNIKLVFLCSPNNPTGNLLSETQIEAILGAFDGLVVVDEAYIDFSGSAGWLPRLQEFPNLVVLQTFSKAWGLAGARLGMAFGNKAIVDVLNSIKYPYNISALTQEAVLQAMNNRNRVQTAIKKIAKEREILSSALAQFQFVKKVFPSQANFILISANNAERIYKHLRQKGILVRNRSGIERCPSCLRITVGLPEENKQLLNALKQVDEQL